MRMRSFLYQGVRSSMVLSRCWRDRVTHLGRHGSFFAAPSSLSHQFVDNDQCYPVRKLVSLSVGFEAQKPRCGWPGSRPGQECRSDSETDTVYQPYIPTCFRMLSKKRCPNRSCRDCSLSLCWWTRGATMWVAKGVEGFCETLAEAV